MGIQERVRDRHEDEWVAGSGWHEHEKGQGGHGDGKWNEMGGGFVHGATWRRYEGGHAWPCMAMRG